MRSTLRVMAALGACLLPTVAPAQSTTRPATGAAAAALAAPSAAAQAATWFKARPVADKVWVIDDHGADNIYLVEGEKQALLIDTGLGVGDLSAFVKTLTKLPIVVVNTHSHPDHAAGDGQFPSVHAHPLDFEAIRAVNTTESRQKTAQLMTSGAPPSGVLSAEQAAQLRPAELIPLKGGDVFDLGGRRLEVVEQPGHTPGEIVLIDAAHRLAFTGDNDNTLVWLFLPTCRPLEVYLESLKKLKQRDAEFDTVLPGHGAALPKTIVADQIACVESILGGTCTVEPYKSFAGDGSICKCKGAAVAFNPANLRVKQ